MGKAFGRFSGLMFDALGFGTGFSSMLRRDGGGGWSGGLSGGRARCVLPAGVGLHNAFSAASGHDAPVPGSTCFSHARSAWPVRKITGRLVLW